MSYLGFFFRRVDPFGRDKIHVQISRLRSELISESQVAVDFDRGLNSRARNPVEFQFILLVENHPEGIPRAERDDDRWEATMGGIAGIIVTQFASLRAAQTISKLGRNWVTSARQEVPGRMRRIDNRTRCTFICF